MRSSRSQSTNSSTSPAALAAVDSTRRRSAVPSSSAAIAAAVRQRSATPGIVAIAFSTWNVATSRPRPELRFARAESRTSPIPSMRPAALASRACSGANSRAEEAEEPAAEEVGVADRRPRQLVEFLFLEAQPVDDPEQDAPIDLLFAAEPLLRLKCRRTSASQSRRASARIGQVRPAVVVLVVARIGGVHRVVAEEVGEERVLRGGKAHGRMVP